MSAKAFARNEQWKCLKWFHPNKPVSSPKIGTQRLRPTWSRLKLAIHKIEKSKCFFLPNKKFITRSFFCNLSRMFAESLQWVWNAGRGFRWALNGKPNFDQQHSIPVNGKHTCTSVERFSFKASMSSCREFPAKIFSSLNNCSLNTIKE